MSLTTPDQDRRCEALASEHESLAVVATNGESVIVEASGPDRRYLIAGDGEMLRLADDPYPDVTDVSLCEAIDHAEANANLMPTSEEYRAWWSARAAHLRAVLDVRNANREGATR